MTIETFQIGIKNRWSYLNATVIQDIVSKVESFADEDISKIMDSLKSHGGDYLSMKIVDKIIYDLGIKKVGASKPRVLVCADCGTNYAQINEPLAGYRCPVCYSFESKTREYDSSMKLITMQSLCLCGEQGNKNCAHFDTKLKDSKAKNINGPSCKTYGVNNNHTKCFGCICRSCCEKTRKENNELIFSRA